MTWVDISWPKLTQSDWSWPKLTQVNSSWPKKTRNYLRWYNSTRNSLSMRREGQCLLDVWCSMDVVWTDFFCIDFICTNLYFPKQMVHILHIYWSDWGLAGTLLSHLSYDSPRLKMQYSDKLFLAISMFVHRHSPSCHTNVLNSCVHCRISTGLLSPSGDLEMDLSGDIPSHPIPSATFRSDCSKHL